jgi:DNA polymerase III subunit delta'
MTSHEQAFPPILGHGSTIQQLLYYLQQERLPGALLFTGPYGIGKATLARRLASLLLLWGEITPQKIHQLEMADFTQPLTARLPSKGPEALLAQTILAKLHNASHPDLWLLPRPLGQESAVKDPKEKSAAPPSEIGVEAIRKMGHFFHLTSAQSGWRIVMIDGVESLNRHAANAVLKILEEPPRQSLFLLTCQRPALLLATLRSRCQQLALTPLGDEAIKTLLSNYQAHSASSTAPKSEAENALITVLCEGAPGKLQAFFHSPLLEWVLKWLEMMEDIVTGQPFAWDKAHSWAQDLAKPAFLSLHHQLILLCAWFCAYLAKHAALAGARAGEPKIPPRLTQLAAALTPQQWQSLWQATQTLERHEALQLDRHSSWILWWQKAKEITQNPPSPLALLGSY